MISNIAPGEFSKSQFKDTDSLLLDDFLSILKKGGKSDKELEEAINSFDRNQGVLEEWESEVLKKEREDRVFWGVEGKQDKEETSIFRKIKKAEEKRKMYSYSLPFG